MTPDEMRALNAERYREIKRWHARYRYSPRRLRNHMRQWWRYLSGDHCLVDNGQGANWVSYRCRRCSRRVTMSLGDTGYSYIIERGCPLTDAWAAATNTDTEVGPPYISVLH